MLLLCYRLRKSLRICPAEHTLVCSMLPPSGSNVHWWHTHPRVPLLNSSPKCALFFISSHSSSSAHFTHSLLSLYSHIWRLCTQMCCSSFRDVTVFLTCTYFSWGLSVCWWNTKIVFIPTLVFIVILGEEIERKMRIGIKVSIALHYQNEL